MKKIDFLNEDKIITKGLFEKILLDISIDVQDELLRQTKRANCDDCQIDMINENTIAVFNLNRDKYLNRFMLAAIEK